MLAETIPAFGALVNLAREGGYDGPSDSLTTEERFKEYLATLPHDADENGEGVQEASGAWTFGLHDPVSDADLPPVTYRDRHRLWPDSPGKVVTQVIAGPKEHKTNWIMAELFRLAIAGIRHER